MAVFQSAGLSFGWSLIRVVSLGFAVIRWSFNQLVFQLSGPSLRWSHQGVPSLGGLSVSWSFIWWSLIRVVSLGCAIIRWSVSQLVFHLDGPSLGWSAIGWSHQGGLSCTYILEGLTLLVQLQQFSLTLLVCDGLFGSFYNPVNCDMDYRIFNMCVV